MNKKIYILLSITILLITAWLLYPRQEDELMGGPAILEEIEEKQQSKQADHQKPVSATDSDISSQVPTKFVDSEDPVGNLRLEGQVIDGNDLPIEGATIVVNSNPKRTTVTEKDGSFYFDKLLPKTYRINARKQSLVAGPKRHTLSADSEPVILRMRTGVEIEVTVLDKSKNSPISGAEVEIRSLHKQQKSTDRRGKVKFQGVSSGHCVAAAQAKGYAISHQVVHVPESSPQPIAVEIKLSTGTSVSGRVVDSDNKPISDAKVLPKNTATFIELGDKKRDSRTTNNDGEFSIPALSKGTYRFVANHDDYVPGTSKAVIIDGQTPIKNIEIVLKSGCSVSGRVVDQDGEAVSWAIIKIVGQNANKRFVSATQDLQYRTTADQHGTFNFSGLPHETFEIMAMSKQASSSVETVDLNEKSKVEELVLTLEVGEKISGIVVDYRDQPVAEASVSAFPDIWEGNFSKATLLRGMVTTTTDGGGNFTISGLREGSYQLRASRYTASKSQLWRKGTKVHTSDENVKLIIESVGSLKGQLTFEDGSTPESFSIALTYPPGTTVQAPDGFFDLKNQPAGTYDITFRGPNFSDKVVANVEIKPDQVTDLGQIKVDFGRTLSGIVVDNGGTSISGANVIAAKRLIGNGESMAIDLGQAGEESMGLIRTQSAEDGSFLIRGIGQERFVVVAEKEELGRSQTLVLDVGDNITDVELVIQLFGKIAGQITSNGKPAAGAMVSASPEGESSQAIVVNADENGQYQINKLPAGRHRLAANLVNIGGLGANSSSTIVEVIGNQKIKVDIDIPLGDVSLSVDVIGENEAKISAAQVILIKGIHAATNVAEFNKIALSNVGSIMTSFWMPGRKASFSKVVPDEYTLCIIPLSGDMSDPAFLQKLQKHANMLAVHCSPQTIAGSPSEQSLSKTVPPMNPFPPEENDANNLQK
jgi:protocatechuate 3,4-dioxygenase beta subunit